MDEPNVEIDMTIANWKPSDIPSMAGRRVLITGATSGLGYQTALVLARAGAEIIMPARSAKKGDDAASRIRQAVPKAVLKTGIMDLTDLASVRAFTERQLRGGEAIDIPINNAGVMAIPKRTLSHDGYEMQFATNVLGPFLLTGLLLPLVLAGQSPRIITLSSGAQRLAKPLALRKNVLRDQDIRADEDGKCSHRQRDSGTRLASIICQPGVAKTNLLAGPQPLYFRAIMGILGPFLKPAEVACWSTLFAATSPMAEPGHYYGPRKTLGKSSDLSESPMCEPATDLNAGTTLFDKLEAMVGAKYQF